MGRIRDMVIGGALVLALVGVGFFGRGVVEGQGSTTTDGQWREIELSSVQAQFINLTPRDAFASFVEALPPGCDIIVVPGPGESDEYVFYRCP